MKGAMVVAALFILSIPGSLMFMAGSGAVQKEGISVMNLFATDDFDLTPLAVNESTMEFTRDDGIWADLPMRPLQWYEIGEWFSPSIDSWHDFFDMGEIGGPTTIWITLSCPEETTMDLYGSFNINYNPAVDPIILEDVIISPEPQTFSFDFDTAGITLEELHSISMRWSMRNGHDDIIVHLGEEEGTGLTTYIEPLIVESIDYLEGFGLSISLYQPFEAWESWDFQFFVSLDDGSYSMIDHYYMTTGGDEYYYLWIEDFDGSTGDHVFRWEADYGLSSHSSGSHNFEIIDEEEPPPDDDEPERPPIINGDDEIELWSFSECDRTYSDETGDEVTYWTTFDSSLNTDSGAKFGEDPRVDIRRINVYRENDDLVIEVVMEDTPELGIVENGIWNTYVYFLDPADDHQQPPLDLGEMPDTSEEDYDPDDAIASTDLFHSSSYWIGTSDVKGNSYFIRGSLSSLMDTDLGSDFVVFIKIRFTEIEDVATEDSLNFRSITDYAGYGAWEVDSSLLYVEQTPAGSSSLSDGNGNLIIYVTVAVIIVAVILIIATIIIMRRKD